MSIITSKIRRALKQHINEKAKDSFQRFFKEKVKYHGVKSSDVSKISKSYFQEVKHLDKSQIFEICEELLKSGYGEEAWIAANWSYWIRDSFTPSDFKVFENWIQKNIDDWAKCDTFCNHTMGSFIEKYPKYLESLKKWTKSNNRWVKRASAVSLIVPAREGKFLKDVFEISDLLIRDEDDMVQKGYGWLLKEASRKNQKEVFNYVLKNKAIMPRTSLRYAIEKMPDNMRRKAMERTKKPIITKINKS